MAFIKTNWIFLLVSLVAIITLASVPAFSQVKKRLKFSSTEDVAIAFYKTGGVVPNFENWIKKNEPYNLTPWARREEVMIQEKSRLQLAYKNFDPKEDFLIIRTFVNLDLTKSSTLDKESQQNKESYNLKISFQKAPDALYFPYDFNGERIVVMPHKLDILMNSALNQQRYNYLEKALKDSGQSTMIVRLLAKESDLSKPYKIDGMEQWVMKTEIVSLEVWSGYGTLLWEHTAPWYISPNTIQLNNLYNKGPSLHPEKGGVKPLPIPQAQ